MPIYAYRCSTCGHAKDVLQKMSDAPLSTCPACGAESFQKQITAAGFQLKGSGWYVTDLSRAALVLAPPRALRPVQLPLRRVRRPSRLHPLRRQRPRLRRLRPPAAARSVAALAPATDAFLSLGPL